MIPFGHLKQEADGTFSIAALEIFRAGDYGEKGSYDEAAIAALAASYDPALCEAPVTVDHKQEGQAFGWVSRVFQKGGALFADIKNIPAEFAALLKSGAFKKRSVEIYRNLEQTGGRYLKAVTFLGAAAPHVKGMRDITFKDGTESDSIDCRADLFISPAVMFPRPADAPDGVLSEGGDTATYLGHYHQYVMDAEGNGFSSSPMHWDDDGMKVHGPSDPLFHQHRIEAGEVLPADDGLGNMHTHATYRTIYNYKEPDMSATPQNPPQNKPTPVVETAEFSELKERMNALAAENKELKDSLLKQQRQSVQVRDVAAFNEAFNAALNHPDGPKVTQGERAGLLSVFMALPSFDDDQVVVSFSDGADNVEVKNPRAMFLASLSARPAFASFGEIKTLSGKQPVRSGSTAKDEMTRKLSERAREICSKHNVSMADAFAMANAELDKV